MDFSGAFSWMNIRFLLEGLKVTVEVSLFSIIFSFLIGGICGVVRFANIPYLETMRIVVLPQAFKSMIPAIVSQLISLIKDTSLAVIISLPELTHQARIVYGQNTNYVLPMFVAMTLMYFAVCYALSLLSSYLEKRKYSY